MRPLVVVMGVTGSGKSTIGALLADALEVPFADADFLHSATNLGKMAAGEALNDDDRWPWLKAVGQTIAESEVTGLVIACSALKRIYRDILASAAPGVVFVHLIASSEVIDQRLEKRTTHFMPRQLLESQLQILEPLHIDEPGVAIEVGGPIDDAVATALHWVRSSSDRE